MIFFVVYRDKNATRVRCVAKLDGQLLRFVTSILLKTC